jgi:hypothetical protein
MEETELLVRNQVSGQWSVIGQPNDLSNEIVSFSV